MLRLGLKRGFSQYLVSVPERLLRSATALSAGLLRELGDVALPGFVRRTRLYETLVHSSLRFLIEQVGEVQGTYPAGDALAENFLLRRTAGNGLELAGILAFRASPVWVMAALADVSGAGKELIHEIASELKKEGLLPADSDAHSIEEMLDGLERTSARIAETFNTPPLDVAGLRKEWDGLRSDFASIPVPNLPDPSILRNRWQAIKEEARVQERSVFEVSSLLAFSAVSQVPDGVLWLGKSAALATRHTGVLVAQKLLDHYSAALSEIRATGFVRYSVQQYRPYLRAAASQFSPRRSSLTQRLLNRTSLLFLLAGSLSAQTPSLRVPAQALEAHVSFLASDLLEGRDTPSPGLALAAEYISAQFRRIGLDAPDKKSYFVEAPPMFSVVTKEASLPVDLSAVSGDLPAIVRGRIVKITDPEGLSRDKIQNQIVFAPMAIAQEIQQNRAALAPRHIFAISPDRVEPRQGVLTIWDSKLQASFETWPEGRTEVVVSTRPAGLKNVVGILRGSSPKLRDQCVVVSAHYDHVGTRQTGEDRIFNGANDDASGVAGVIGAAEALSKARPLRTVVFVTFFGEEKGLMGSTFYAQSPACPIANTVAQLNLEQIGRTDDAKGPRVGAVTLTGNDYSDVSLWFAKAIAGTGGKLDPLNGDDFFARSDNAALARLGIPAHTVSVAFEFPDYHQPGDEAQKLDYKNMALVTQMVAKAAAYIGNQPGTPRWRTVNPKAEPFAKVSTPLAVPRVASGPRSGNSPASPKPQRQSPSKAR